MEKQPTNEQKINTIAEDVSFLTVGTGGMAILLSLLGLVFVYTGLTSSGTDGIPSILFGIILIICCALYIKFRKQIYAKLKEFS